jgi:hypothetical protein
MVALIFSFRGIDGATNITHITKNHVLEVVKGEESTLLKEIEVWDKRYVVPSR